MWKRVLAVLSMITLAGLSFLGSPTGIATQAHATQPLAFPPTDTGERVMTIGSSVAAGWGDTQGGGGYLNRAFGDLSVATKHDYHMVSWAVPGITSVQVAPHYTKWLSFVRPKVVVISWGGLDDAVNHISVSAFRRQVTREIALALDDRAMVLVVTPPVTQAVYEEGTKGLPYQYFQAEIDVAHSFRSPDVYVFDVYDQMLRYMALHHVPLSTYVHDSWHPNSAGHALAGQLLAADITKQFGHQLLGYTP